MTVLSAIISILLPRLIYHRRNLVITFLIKAGNGRALFAATYLNLTWIGIININEKIAMRGVGGMNVEYGFIIDIIFVNFC